MDDIQVLRHIQPVRTTVAVNVMAAVIHSKAYQGPVVLPMGLNQFAEHTEGAGIVPQLSQRMDILGANLVHPGIVVAVVDNDKVIFVFQNHFSGFGINFFNGFVEKIVHIPVLEDLADAALGVCDDYRLFACPKQRIENGVDGDHWLFIPADAVNSRLGAGLHGAEANGCY